MRSILQVSGIAVQPAIVHDLCNMAMQSFYVKPTNPFILFTIILCAAARRARGQKVSLWSDYLPFFHGRCFKTMRTDPSSVNISFANAAQLFIMFWHDSG